MSLDGLFARLNTLSRGLQENVVDNACRTIHTMHAQGIACEDIKLSIDGSKIYFEWPPNSRVHCCFHGAYVHWFPNGMSIHVIEDDITRRRGFDEGAFDDFVLALEESLTRTRDWERCSRTY